MYSKKKQKKHQGDDDSNKVANISNVGVRRSRNSELDLAPRRNRVSQAFHRNERE